MIIKKTNREEIKNLLFLFFNGFLKEQESFTIRERDPTGRKEVEFPIGNCKMEGTENFYMKTSREWSEVIPVRRHGSEKAIYFSKFEGNCAF